MLSRFFRFLGIMAFLGGMCIILALSYLCYNDPSRMNPQYTIAGLGLGVAMALIGNLIITVTK